MAHTFVHKPVVGSGGLTMEPWINQVARAAEFAGDEKIRVATGETLKLSSTGIRLSNPEMVQDVGADRLRRYGEHKKADDRAVGWYFTTHHEPFHLADGLMASRIKNGKGLQETDVYMPLGFAGKEATNENVVRSMAQLYLQGGVLTNYRAKDEHVAPFHLRVIRDLVWSTVTCEDLKQQKAFFELACRATATAHEWSENHPETKAVYQAMLDSEITSDTLQRSIAYSLVQAIPETEDVLRMAEVALKRSSGRGRKCLLEDLSGPLAMFHLAYPLLRGQTSKDINAEYIDGFWQGFSKTLVACTSLAARVLTSQESKSGGGDNKSSLLAEEDVRFLHLLRPNDFKDARSCASLVMWCRDPKNFHVQAPLAKLGLIKEVPCPIPFATKAFEGFTIKKDAVKSATFKVLDDKRVRIRGRDTTSWSAVEMPNGTYLLSGQPIGVATASENKDIRGSELEAIYRVSFTRDVFPFDREGASTAGKMRQFVRRTRRWDYLDIPEDKRFRLTDATRLVVTDDQVTIGNLSMGRLVRGDTVHVSFKNCSLTVEKVVEDKGDSKKQDTGAASMEVSDDDGRVVGEMQAAGLSATALLKQLSQVALARGTSRPP